MNLYAKKELTNDQMIMLESEMNKVRKNKTPAWLLWVFTGPFGGHRFYMGDIGYAIAMLFLGWATFGIWWLVDAFFINKRIEEKNNEKELELINQIK